ncbi:MAG: hypothetical protein ABW221_20180 [Vicinamibacteria bacterium]
MGCARPSAGVASRWPLPRAAAEALLHRLFTTFPTGLTGAGLLVLRAAVGLALVARGCAAALGRDVSGPVLSLALVAIVCGLGLLAGFLTPLASVLAGAVTAAEALFARVPAWTAADGAAGWTLLLSAAVALALAGPGAFSADARLFGRREIEVPRRVAPEDSPRS